jgi:hypothetical protein
LSWGGFKEGSAPERSTGRVLGFTLLLLFLVRALAREAVFGRAIVTKGEAELIAEVSVGAAMLFVDEVESSENGGGASETTSGSGEVSASMGFGGETGSLASSSFPGGAALPGTVRYATIPSTAIPNPEPASRRIISKPIDHYPFETPKARPSEFWKRVKLH